MTHHCHYPPCGKVTPPKYFMCGRDWGRLPPEMQAEIWEHYRWGQEVTKDPSPSYLIAAQAAIDYLVDLDALTLAPVSPIKGVSPAAPFTSADALRAAVVKAYGGQCSCSGECGHKHADRSQPKVKGARKAVKVYVQRCPVKDSPVLGDVLHAVPKDLGLSLHAAIKLPASELRPMCDDCHKAALGRVGKGQPAAAPEMGLFDMGATA